MEIGLKGSSDGTSGAGSRLGPLRYLVVLSILMYICSISGAVRAVSTGHLLDATGIRTLPPAYSDQPHTLNYLGAIDWPSPEYHSELLLQGEPAPTPATWLSRHLFILPPSGTAGTSRRVRHC